MTLPSFTITGTLLDLLGNTALGEIVGNGLGGATPATVTFTPNVPAGYFVTFGGVAYRVDPVTADVNSDGTITRNGEPVQLLANDAGLSVDGLQWQVHATGMHRFWANAPVDGGTLNLGTVAPVPGLGVSGVAFSAGELVTLLADGGSSVRVALDALYSSPTLPTGSVAFAKLASAAVVTASETIAANNNDTTIPTSAAVQAAITAAVTALLNGAPGALDTLKELADAINDDASFAATVTTALSKKVAVVTYTGSLTTTRPTADAVYWSGYPSTPTNAQAQDIVSGVTASFITSTGGTTTLTSTSAPRQVVTGTAYQQIVLPTTGVKAGDAFEVDCETSGSVDISPSSTGTIVTLQQSETGYVVALIDTPTTTAHWAYRLASVFHPSLGSADFTVVVRSTGGAVAVGSVELGHASDTTITRVSAGNIAVEGNAIYRAGGTDVPITDGGTGVSTLPTGLLKGAGTGAITAATAGTDYTSPSSTETQTNKTLTNPTITNYTESVVAIGNTSTAKTISLTSGTMQTATLTGNCTFTMPTAVAGKSFSLALATGAGSFTATFTGVKWAAGAAPTVTAAASKTDVFSFTCFDGTNWIGSVIQAVA